MPEVIFDQNDNLVELNGLTNVQTGAFINSATVTGSLFDETGTVVPGADGFGLNYVTDSDGDYVGTLADSLTLNTNRFYTLVVDADAGSGLKGHWEIEAIVRKRRG